MIRTYKVVISLILLFLVLAASWMRIDIFKKTSRIFATIDEIVYFRMAKQVTQDWRDYHTIPFGHELKPDKPFLHGYFFQPLFKHPPLFTFLLAGALKVLGMRPLSAAYVPIFFGVMLIPLTYFLGVLFFDRLTGLLAALVVFFDPVLTMTSQKIWPDTTMAFFMVLGFYLFARALKTGRDYLFSFSGLALGAAIMTKYPGGLVMAGIVFYAVLYERHLFKNRSFILGIFVIPFLTSIPWMVWNYLVYGLGGLSRHAELRNLFEKVLTPGIGLLVLLAGVVFYLWHRHLRKSAERKVGRQAFPISARFRRDWALVIVLFFGILLSQHLVRSLQFDYVPLGTWYTGYFNTEPAYFYFGRLIEYSFLYALAFYYLFTSQPMEEKTIAPLRLIALLILIFFTAWGGFQSRYVLPAIPVLILLGVHAWLKFFEYFSRLPSRNVSWVGRVALLALFVFIVARTLHINDVLSYSNDMCYF